MREIKREVTTEQVVYEITKEELDSIKREERIIVKLNVRNIE